jgi:membrane associated rhomboid family serine protease
MYHARFIRSRIIDYLIVANAFMFLLTITFPPLFRLFALTPATILIEPWTLLTSMFIHAGFGHILFNMIALFFFGSYLERITSTEDFLKVYFLGGVFAGLSYVFTSIFFNIPDPRISAVGASGAIFAVIGALVVLRPKMTIYLNFLFPMPLWMFAAFYVIMALGSMGAGLGAVAENAHLGGLIAGFIFGKYFKNRLKPTAYIYQGYRYY